MRRRLTGIISTWSGNSGTTCRRYVWTGTRCCRFSSTSSATRSMPWPRGARTINGPFDRLVRIGHATHDDYLRFPFRRRQLRFKQLRRVRLDHDFAFEIESRGKPEIFVGWAGKAVNAAVLATAIRIDTGLDSDIRTVVVRNDRFCAVAEKLRLASRPLFVAFIDLNNIDIAKIDMQLFEAISRTPRSASTVNHGRRRRSFFDDGHEQIGRAHV